MDYKEVLLTESKRPAEPHVYEQYFEDIDRWLRITNRAIYWVDGTLALLVTFFDITESKSTKSAFRIWPITISGSISPIARGFR